MLILRQTIYNFIERLAPHLDRIQRRTAGLLGQSSCASVPKLHEIETRIIDRRGVHTAGITLIIHSCGTDPVACCTRNRPVGRETCVVVELFSELGLTSIVRKCIGNGTNRLVGKLRRSKRIRVEFSLYKS